MRVPRGYVIVDDVAVVVVVRVPVQYEPKLSWTSLGIAAAAVAVVVVVIVVSRVAAVVVVAVVASVLFPTQNCRWAFRP